MTYPASINASASPEVPMNENLRAIAWAGCYSNKASTTAGLVRGYNGGNWGAFTPADEDHTFGASTTTYVSVDLSDGSLDFSTSSTNFTDDANYATVEIVTSTADSTTAVDRRGGPGGVHGRATLAALGGGDVNGPASATDGDIARFDGTTGKLLKAGLALDTDGTLAANSDAKIASQKAVKTAIATAISNLVGTAPGVLDTLGEISDAINDDANLYTTLVAALVLKAPLASPALTGTPTVPTASAGTNTTQAASTAFVVAEVAAGGGSSLPWIDVTDAAYGAVGDGSTDDTAAVTAAIAAIPSTGGVLYFPAGTYKTSGGFTLSNQTRILGDGCAGSSTTGTVTAISTVTCTSTTAHLFTFSHNGCSIEKIHLADSVASTRTAGAGLRIATGHGTRIADLSVYGFYNQLQVEDGYEWFMERSFFFGPINYSLYLSDVAIPDGGDAAISDCDFVAVDRDAPAAIRAVSGGGLKFANCKINERGGHRYTNGIDVLVDAGCHTSQFTWNGCSIENVSQTPIKVRNTSPGSWLCFIIVNSEFGLIDDNYHAIDIAATAIGKLDEVIIDNCVFYCDSSAVSAIALVNLNNVIVGTNIYQSFPSTYTATGCTNLVNASGSGTGPGYAATSTTSLATAGSGSKAFTTQSGLAYTAGARIRATSAGTAEYMEGVVTAYSGTTLTVTMDRNSGTGTHADWNINLAGDVGATGATGAAGSNGTSASYAGTSTTSLAIGTGSTAFTTQASLAYTVGTRARFSSAANTSNWMEGVVTAYSSTTLTALIDKTSGSGTHADWNLSVAGEPGAAGANGASSSGGPTGVAGRLTLESGVPVSTTDQTAKTTVYWTPYNGNQMQLWDGSAWTTYTFSETSLALGTLTSAKNYDVFGYQSSGTVTLESLAWTNDTTRATAITLQDGRYCKSGDKTRLYLGTFRTTSTTTTEDSAGGTTTQVGGKRFLWNHYNRVRRPLSVKDTANTWTYNTATIRQANGAAGNKIEFVVGVSDFCFEAILSGGVNVGANSGRANRLGIGIDSITAFSGAVQSAYSTSASVTFSMTVPYIGTLAAGYHYAAWLEAGGDGTNNWTGSNGSAQSMLQAAVAG